MNFLAGVPVGSFRGHDLISSKVYKTSFDTTLGLYREGAEQVELSYWYEHTEDAFRVAGPYTMRHLLWYEDPRFLLDDQLTALRTKGGTWRYGKWSQFMADHLQIPLSVDCWSGPFKAEYCCDLGPTEACIDSR